MYRMARPGASSISCAVRALPVMAPLTTVPSLRGPSLIGAFPLCTVSPRPQTMWRRGEQGSAMPASSLRTRRHAHPRPAAPPTGALPKAPSGINGLDEITGGGLPRGRPTLVCGGAGCGKTLFAHGVPGARAPPSTASRASSCPSRRPPRSSPPTSPRSASTSSGSRREKKLAIDHVRVERSEIEETGEYDLEGLFVRLQDAISRVGAKRVVLDTVESLFSGLPNPGILRSELRRLFRWLKERGLTAVDHRRRRERERSPATGSRSTSPTASSSSTTASTSRSRRGGCAS